MCEATHARLLVKYTHSDKYMKLCMIIHVFSMSILMVVANLLYSALDHSYTVGANGFTWLQ